MKRLLPIVLLLSAPAIAAAPTTIAGTWTISGLVQGVDFTDLCTFTLQDAAITGTCKGDDGKSHDTTGTVGPKNITFSHAGEYQGDPLTLSYTGTLADDGTLSGSVDVQPQDVSGSFTAKRTPPAAAAP